MKAAMKCKNTIHWTSELPLIMLGIRCTLKEDIQATPAEMVYGKTLRLPGEFFTEQTERCNETEFIKQFRQIMNNIRPTPTAHHTNTQPYIQKELANSSHVFIRNDTVRTPLQHPYDGPFLVIKRYEKVYKVLVNQKPKNISIDRLKAAFIENNIGTPTHSENSPSPTNQIPNNNDNNPSSSSNGHIQPSTSNNHTQNPSSQHDREGQFDFLIV